VTNTPGCWSDLPPDDGGDPAKTLLWMKEQDLIEITAVEERP
jgi:hypothetical protein